PRIVRLHTVGPEQEGEEAGGTCGQPERAHETSRPCVSHGEEEPDEDTFREEGLAPEPERELAELRPVEAVEVQQRRNDEGSEADDEADAPRLASEQRQPSRDGLPALLRQ